MNSEPSPSRVNITRMLYDEAHARRTRAWIAERGVFDSEQVDELARMKQDVSDAELLFGSWNIMNDRRRMVHNSNPLDKFEDYDGDDDGYVASLHPSNQQECINNSDPTAEGCVLYTSTGATPHCDASINGGGSSGGGATMGTLPLPPLPDSVPRGYSQMIHRSSSSTASSTRAGRASLSVALPDAHTPGPPSPALPSSSTCLMPTLTRPDGRGVLGAPISRVASNSDTHESMGRRASRRASFNAAGGGCDDDDEGRDSLSPCGRSGSFTEAVDSRLARLRGLTSRATSRSFSHGTRPPLFTGLGAGGDHVGDEAPDLHPAAPRDTPRGARHPPHRRASVCVSSLPPDPGAAPYAPHAPASLRPPGTPRNARRASVRWLEEPQASTHAFGHIPEHAPGTEHAAAGQSAYQAMLDAQRVLRAEQRPAPVSRASLSALQASQAEGEAMMAAALAARDRTQTPGPSGVVRHLHRSVSHSAARSQSQPRSPHSSRRGTDSGEDLRVIGI